MFQKRRGYLWSGGKLHMDGKCLLEEVLFRLFDSLQEREQHHAYDGLEILSSAGLSAQARRVVAHCSSRNFCSSLVW